MEEILRLTRMTCYADFRKIMKKRSERITERLPNKFFDMEPVQKYTKRSDEEINTERLQELYKIKISEASEVLKSETLKENAAKFLKMILRNHTVTNPVEIEVLETLNCIRLREVRTCITNVLNAMRCYHRSIDIDLRVIGGCEFKFELDDSMLINSNKQLLEKFERNLKDNETMLSKSPSALPTLSSEEFLQHKTLERTMIYKKDIVSRQHYGKEIPHLLVSDGQKKKNQVMYEIALEDLKLVEKRILEVGTHFINRYERLIKIRSLPELADRMKVISELFEFELKYLYQKFNLIEKYYYIYENTTEPLHAHKVAKLIVSLVYARPEIDLSA